MTKYSLTLYLRARISATTGLCVVDVITLVYLVELLPALGIFCNLFSCVGCERRVSR